MRLIWTMKVGLKRKAILLITGFVGKISAGFNSHIQRREIIEELIYASYGRVNQVLIEGGHDAY